jgi:hypothetical protein
VQEHRCFWSGLKGVDLALAAERLCGKNRVVTDVGTEINEGSVDGQ